MVLLLDNTAINDLAKWLTKENHPYDEEEELQMYEDYLDNITAWNDCYGEELLQKKSNDTSVDVSAEAIVILNEAMAAVKNKDLDLAFERVSTIGLELHNGTWKFNYVSEDGVLRDVSSNALNGLEIPRHALALELDIDDAMFVLKDMQHKLSTTHRMTKV